MSTSERQSPMPVELRSFLDHILAPTWSAAFFSPRACLLLVLSFALLPACAWSQSELATVFGTVTDSSGAVIPSAQVAIVNQNTGLKRDTVTDMTGQAKAAERPETLSLWRDFVLRLSSTPVVSVAKIRGRTRGIGNEFVLACDMRFASRQSALFGQPEIGVGLVPGGGALEWLPRLVGRSRALEIVLSGDDFDADIAERYGWVNRTLDDDALDSFVDALARRLASFDRETLAAAKAQINRFGTPTAAELQSSNDLFFPLLALPGAQARRAKVRNVGYGVPSDFELNFGRYLPRFGQADDDDTEAQAS